MSKLFKGKCENCGNEETIEIPSGGMFNSEFRRATCPECGYHVLMQRVSK